MPLPRQFGFLLSSPGAAAASPLVCNSIAIHLHRNGKIGKAAFNFYKIYDTRLPLSDGSSSTTHCQHTQTRARGGAGRWKTREKQEPDFFLSITDWRLGRRRFVCCDKHYSFHLRRPVAATTISILLTKTTDSTQEDPRRTINTTVQSARSYTHARGMMSASSDVTLSGKITLLMKGKPCATLSTRIPSILFPPERNTHY